MPLIALAVSAYAAGLLLGFGGLLILGAAAGALFVAVGVLERRSVPLALGLLLGGGMLEARWSVAAGERCRSRFATAHRFLIRLDAPVAPGGYVNGRAHLGNCDADAWLSVERGSAEAGTIVSVIGSAVPVPRGVKIVHAVIAASTAASFLARTRARAAALIDTLFRDDAPLVRALLVADQREIAPDVRDRFAAAGIVHILSVSGLHVAIIALAVQLLAGALRMPAPMATALSIGITAAYVAVIGAPPPALRAAVMLAVGVLTKVLQRPTSPWALLALGAAIPLAVPSTVLDLGYQLSVAGMASLVASGALAKRWLHRSRGWSGRLLRSLLASTVASLVTAPLVAWTFGRLSLVAPLANLAATPIIGALQPALFLALALAPARPVAQLVADGSHLLLAALDMVARAGAAVPHGSIVVTTSLLAAWCMGASAVALVIACVSDTPLPPALAGVLAIAGAVWLPLVAPAPKRAEVHVVDVGQGDAIAIRSPAGRWVIVDAGRTWHGGDAARSTLIPYLQRRGGAVIGFVLSHPHADHAGGAATLLSTEHPRDFWDGAYAGGSGPYHDALIAAARAGVHWHRVHAGDSVAVDGLWLTFLAPDSAWMQQIHDPNLASVVVRVRYGTSRFLLMGDAEREEESWLLNHVPAEALRADVLKVAHHGSVTSSSAPFLDAVRPRLALISVGAGNSYGHPSAQVIRALVRRGTVVLRTDAAGSIVVQSDGTNLEVEEDDTRWTLSPRSPR